MNLKIGVLSIQGDVEEHLSSTREALNKLGIKGAVVTVKNVRDAKGINALIIPGGESTVIGELSSANGVIQMLREMIQNGLPTLGTCAGMIMLAKNVYDRSVGVTNQEVLGVLDIVVERNSFGRQKDSFEAEIELKLFEKKKIKGVFIRAPIVRSIGPNVKVIAELEGKVVAVQQGNVIGTSFHPELSGDTILHEYLIELARQNLRS